MILGNVVRVFNAVGEPEESVHDTPTPAFEVDMPVAEPAKADAEAADVSA